MNKLGDRKEQKEQMLEMYKIAVRVNGIGCNKCKKRGFKNWNEELGQYIPCECVLKAAEKVRLEKRKHPTKEQVPEQVN